MVKKIVLLCAVALLTMSWSAFGLELTPTDCTPGYPCWTGTQTGMPSIYAEIAALGITGVNDSTLTYKQDVGGPESGPFAPYYETSFFNSPSDPTDATITFVGEPSQAMTGAEYLLVKDGSQDPSWYLFGLSLWNGIDDIVLTDFWPGQGAISHVSIYGGASVPEPATLFLLGTAMAGLAIFRRRAAH